MSKGIQLVTKTSNKGKAWDQMVSRANSSQHLKK